MKILSTARVDDSTFKKAKHRSVSQTFFCICDLEPENSTVKEFLEQKEASNFSTMHKISISLLLIHKKPFKVFRIK